MCSSTEWNWTDEDRGIGAIVSSYRVNFAKTRDPNGPGLPEWKPFKNSDQRVMLMNDQFVMAMCRIVPD